MNQSLDTYKKQNPRHAVVIVRIGNRTEWAICLKSVEAYCRRYNLDLEIVSKPKYNVPEISGYNTAIFEKFQVADFFDRYDRILRLDADVLIAPRCPNLFERIPEDAIGAVYEDVGSRQDERRETIRTVQTELGDVSWETGYFNSGVLVASRVHRELFRFTEADIRLVGQLKLGAMKEQTLLNWRVQKSGFPVHDPGYPFNHMHFFSEAWNGNPDRRTSHIIHYAGVQHIKFSVILSDFKYLFKTPNVHVLPSGDIRIIKVMPDDALPADAMRYEAVRSEEDWKQVVINSFWKRQPLNRPVQNVLAEPLNAIKLNLFNTYIPGNRSLDMLGLGWQTAPFGIYFSEKGHRVVCADLPEIAVAAKNSYSIPWSHCDFNHEFPDDRFDILFCAQILESVSRDFELLKMMFDHLTEGGLAFVESAMTLPEPARFYQRPKLRTYPDYSLDGLLRTAGFDIVFSTHLVVKETGEKQLFTVARKTMERH